ncbi:DUF4097 family beta strand repeat-containing protein [Nonomuraea jiangxiensis]|uniref:DUF4097 domain-containing protein n=1 Tax=Nonomuraea jiangxiensis TaxID=633440 RepID=A0A1G9K780_9ACTN|nr:DUF4097 family beta strand repeat-containing protein [Nonomuraea jiangxiensis]SDL45657.1 hypothetical protein SAMN05421869_12630 [Nonomuraea jiangxiensis]
MRAAWLASGAVATLIALMTSTALLWGLFAHAEPPVTRQSRAIPFARDDVRIQVGKGHVNVSIEPGEAGELLVFRELRWSADRPTVTETWEEHSGTLRLDAECHNSDQPDGPLCVADYSLFVPPETRVEAGTASGALNVNRLFGGLRLTSLSGDVNIHDVAGSVWVRTGTGNVIADRLNGEEADVEVGSGDVHLRFREPPTKVRAVVRTSGNVGLTVPDLPYGLTVRAADSIMNVHRDDRSPRQITATAPTGVVTVTVVHRP